MSRRTYAALAIWFVLVVSCVIGAYVPLHFWSAPLRNAMPQGVELLRVSGHWWAGRAQLSVASLPQPLFLNWSMSSLFEPIRWHLNHPQLVGYGQLQPSLERVSLWVEGLRIEADVLNPALQAQSVHISGQAIEINHWFSVYHFHDEQFVAFRANADWSEGHVRYQIDDYRTQASITNWQIHGFLQEHDQRQQPVLVLRSGQGRNLFEMKLLPNWELELTVMPELIEALGQRWPGKKDYPAFVMIQPLTQMWR